MAKVMADRYLLLLAAWALTAVGALEVVRGIVTALGLGRVPRGTN